VPAFTPFGGQEGGRIRLTPALASLHLAIHEGGRIRLTPALAYSLFRRIARSIEIFR